MNTFTLMGDPTSIGNAMLKIHRDNPAMNVIAHSAAPYVINSKLNPNPMPVHVLYVTFDGPALVDENGKILPFQGPVVN